jgi:adenine phosphoribosyltransferase|tara:strand:- start:387 stop:899 length:513 start_codon:yes stop_codon:yes gene_type:complete
MDYKNLIRSIPDFPQVGILFRDITPLIQDPIAYKSSIKDMLEVVENLEIDGIAAVEARGYLFGAPMAVELGVPFIPIRKLGKLPYETTSIEYQLEYGTATLEMHTDALTEGQNILLVDDLLATGGTLKAAASLIEIAKGNVIGISVLIELLELSGRELLEEYSVTTIMKY